MAGNNNIYIGNQGMNSEEGQIRIGTGGLQTRTYIAGIRNAAVTGSPVVIGMGGKLGVTMSSAQFKEAIKPMDKASEAILELKPVTFHYKKEVDPDGIPQFGLVAEQVEKVNPDLVVRDDEGKVSTVRYEAVNAMLLNEFLKEHRTVQEQQKEIDTLKGELKEQRALIQKVNDKVELDKPAPQTVLNNQ
jgi:Chaperone of endosialidase